MDILLGKVKIGQNNPQLIPPPKRSPGFKFEIDKLGENQQVTNALNSDGESRFKNLLENQATVNNAGFLAKQQPWT